MILDVSQPGRCKACQRIVFWRIEKSGKPNPYNPPERCGPCQGEGRITVPDLLGGVTSACTRCDGRGRVQVSHFATCPAAATFRKKQGK